MRKLTQKQQNLLNLVTNNDGFNTHQLAELRNDRQAYESNLRDRLFVLERQGLIKSEEKTGKHHQVIARKWYVVA